MDVSGDHAPVSDKYVRKYAKEILKVFERERARFRNKEKPFVYSDPDKPEKRCGRKPTTHNPRIVRVPVVDGMRLWQPNDTNQEIANILLGYIEDITVEGPAKQPLPHPVLHFASCTITEHNWEEFANKKWGEYKTCSALAMKYLSKMGISKTKDTLTFNLGAWNENGYRCARNGDGRGGKPTIEDY